MKVNQRARKAVARRRSAGKGRRRSGSRRKLKLQKKMRKRKHPLMMHMLRALRPKLKSPQRRSLYQISSLRDRLV